MRGRRWRRKWTTPRRVWSVAVVITLGIGIYAVVAGNSALLTFSGDLLLALGMIEAQQFHNRNRNGGGE